MASRADRRFPPFPRRAGAARLGAGAGLVLTLVVAVPTLAFAEDWHGKPLIDQGGLTWLVPAVIVALAFAVGGAVAGRHGVSPGRALVEGLWVGVPGVLALLAADAVRRLVVNPTLPNGVIAYWLEGAAAAIFFALAGAVAGRLLAGHRRSASPAG
ncbi:MAG: hypothetical protein ACYCU7_03745 [Acidimicrobiales bacterium]